MRTDEKRTENVVIEQPAERQNGPIEQYISLSQAAKHWGKSKNTLSVDLKKGKLQWIEHQGKKMLMTTQVAQLYGQPMENDQRTAPEEFSRAEIERAKEREKEAEINGLRSVLQSKEEQIRLLLEQLERERVTAERWHKAFEETKALPAPAKPSFWQRLTGSRA